MAGKAAAHGNATAKLCLAMLLRYGEGVIHDEARARNLLEEAANAGQPAAMFHGEMHAAARRGGKHLGSGNLVAPRRGVAM